MVPWRKCLNGRSRAGCPRLPWHTHFLVTPQDQNKESKPLSLEWSGVLGAVWTVRVEQKAALCSSGLSASGFGSMGSCHVAKTSITSSRKMAWKVRQSYCEVVMMACTDRFNSVLSATTFIKTWDEHCLPNGNTTRLGYARCRAVPPWKVFSIIELVSLSRGVFIFTGRNLLVC